MVVQITLPHYQMSDSDDNQNTCSLFVCIFIWLDGLDRKSVSFANNNNNRLDKIHVTLLD